MVFVIVLYVHVLTTLVVASSFTIEAAGLSRMRRAKTINEASLWVNLVGMFSRTTAWSGLILLLSGGFLAGKMEIWSLAWPKVAVVALLLIAPLAAVSGKRMRRLRELLLNGPTNPAMTDALSDRFLTFSLNLRLWILAGIILIMTAQPSGISSITIVAASVVLGLLSAAFGPKSKAALTTVDAPSSTRS